MSSESLFYSRWGIQGFNFKFNDSDGVEHQYENTECGIYSLFFIIHMLQDKTTESFYKNHIIKDNQIQNYRKIYFNEEL